MKSYSENTVNNRRRTHTCRNAGIVILLEVGDKHRLILKISIHDFGLICRRIAVRQHKPDTVALVAEIFCNNKTVAAVFSRAAENRNRLGRRIQADNG